MRGLSSAGRSRWLALTFFHLFFFFFFFSSLSPESSSLSSPFDLLHAFSQRHPSGAESETGTRKERAGSKKRAKKSNQAILAFEAVFFFDLDLDLLFHQLKTKNNDVGVLALPDVQGQDQAPAPPRERRGGADVRGGVLFFVFLLKEKRETGKKLNLKNLRGKKNFNQPLPDRSHQPNGRRPPAP